jgi:ubiquinone/menaquinone biosynthesis C-methylase UbiE
MMHLRPTDIALELGCGTGSTALRLAPSVARYIATDDAGEMCRIARERSAERETLEILQARLGDASLPDEPVDAILAFNLLHLLPDLEKALFEIARRIRPGGLLIAKTPCLQGRYRALWPIVRSLNLVGFAPPIRFLSTNQLELAVVKAGFTIEDRDDLPKKPPSRFLVARNR